MTANLSYAAKPNATAEPTPTTDDDQVPFDVFPYHVSESSANPAPELERNRSRLPRHPRRIGHADCPACGGETMNGAGLYTCTDCSWTGSR